MSLKMRSSRWPRWATETFLFLFSSVLPSSRAAVPDQETTEWFWQSISSIKFQTKSSISVLFFFSREKVYNLNITSSKGSERKWKWSCSVVSDSLRPRGRQPTRLLRPWDSPSKNTGVGCHFLLQGIFPTQGSNPGLLHCRQTLYRLSHQGSPDMRLLHT